MPRRRRQPHRPALVEDLRKLDEAELLAYCDWLVVTRPVPPELLDALGIGAEALERADLDPSVRANDTREPHRTL